MDTNNDDWVRGKLIDENPAEWSIVVGWIEKTSENLEHVTSEVEPVVPIYLYQQFCFQWYSRVSVYLRRTKITDVDEHIIQSSTKKKNYHLWVSSVVCAVPNEWTRCYRRRAKSENYTIVDWPPLEPRRMVVLTPLLRSCNSSSTARKIKIHFCCPEVMQLWRGPHVLVASLFSTTNDCCCYIMYFRKIKNDTDE